MHFIVQMAVILCCVCVTSGAFADPPKKQRNDAAARRHFESGREYFERAEYDAAVREFEEAYRLSGRETLLINLSKAHEAAGRAEDAVRAIDLWFEQAAPEDPLRGEMETRRNRLRAAAERAAAEAQAAKPTPEDPESVQPAEPPQAQPVAAAEPSSKLGPWPWVTIGAGGALLGAGAVFVVLGRSDIDAVENPDDDATWADVEEQHDRGPTRVALGIGLASVGTLAIAGGVTWLLLGKGSKEANLNVGLGVDHVALRGRF